MAPLLASVPLFGFAALLAANSARCAETSERRVIITPERVDALELELRKLGQKWAGKRDVMAVTFGVSLPGMPPIAVSAGRTGLGTHKVINFTKLRNVTDKDKFLFGSATKMYTAAAVLRLVEAGRFGLDDAALPLMDRLFRKLNGTSLEAYFGFGVRNITVRHLLGMSSGIPDFDVRSRVHQLHHLKEDLDPIQNIFFAKPLLEYPAGANVSYSSTNYELLGLILAQAANASSWDTYSQASGLPQDLATEMSDTDYGIHGTCSNYQPVVSGVCSEGSVHMTDRMSCTNGWACGNLLSNGADAAHFVRALLGPEERVLKNSTLAQMLMTRNFTHGWGQGKYEYGLGVMEMSFVAGKPQGSHAFVGHGGETYGFNSVVGYLDSVGAGIACSFNNEFGLSYRATTEVIEAVERHLLENGRATETILV